MRMPVHCTVIMIVIIARIYLKLLGQIEEIYWAVFCFIGALIVKRMLSSCKSESGAQCKIKRWEFDNFFSIVNT